MERDRKDSRRGVFLADRGGRPLVVIGITHSHTCLVLTGRLRALREAGFRVVLAASPGDLLKLTAEREGVEVLPIPMRREFAPFADLVSLFRLVKALLRLRPEITEFSTPKAGLLGNIAALLCGVPCRVYLLRGLRLETVSGPSRWILRATERIAAACSHVVLCNSFSLRERALSLRLAPAGKLRVLGPGTSNGVDVTRFTPWPRGRRRQADAPVIGFVGRLTRDKGLPELLLAFSYLLKSEPAARLLLVGWFDESEDALPPALRVSIERDPHIQCTGMITDTRPWYSQMDLMVLPTHREGFPNVTLEAAASGVPVITTFATGARDSVEDGVTGLIVPVGDPRAITEAMLQLLADPERRHRMGAAARRWVVERFHQARVHSLIVAFYQGLLQNRLGHSENVTITGAAAAAD